MRAAVSAVVTAALLPLLAAPSAQAHPTSLREHPRSFTGYAFDTCDAPSQKAMNRWWTHSKYGAVGIYIAGMNRACSSQPHLTRRWVQRQSAKGWRLLPLVVGRQAACAPKGYYKHRRISSDPRGGYRTAQAQGRSAADNAVQAARRLGIAKHSVLWFDLEHFDSSRQRCRQSALAFTSAWSRGLRDRHYQAGFYSSASSGISVVDAARRHSGDSWRTPDYLWIAEWNYRDTLGSGYISRQRWWPHRRVHQYRGGHDERHGGVRLNVDSNYLSTGRGTLPGRSAPHCGVRIDFRSYSRLERGDHGARVRAAQCLLKQHGRYHGRLDGRFTKATKRAVHAFQRHHGHLNRSGNIGRGTWAALLSDGARPVLKVGTGGNAVRRFQRAVNASSDARLPVDGVFGKRDMNAVLGFQKRTHLRRTGVVAAATWRALSRGKVVGHLPRRHSHARALLDTFWMSVPFSSGARPR